MSLRMVPILHFVYDESIEHGLKMGAMIYAARQRDEALRGEQEQPGTDDAAQVDSQAEAKPDEGRA